MKTYVSEFPMEVSIPNYEKVNFGCAVAELRLRPKAEVDDEWMALSSILGDKDIDVCTFKGREDTRLVQVLNDMGFKFISTFYTLSLDRTDFMETTHENIALRVEEATDADIERVYDIERGVFDYSTYQMDDRLSADKMSERNVRRVASYVGKPNNLIFLIKRDSAILGFIQFLYDDDIAHAVNGAIVRSLQDQFVGSLMYSGAFKSIFNTGITTITSGVSAQNIRALRIHQACGFKIIDAEIHLRWIRK